MSQAPDQLEGAGSGIVQEGGGQEALIEAWWGQLDESTRRRLLRLAPEDFLPADVALDLQMAGVTVIAVGTVASGNGYDGLYEQPGILLASLQERRRAG